MSREILDCLKRKQDICIKNIIPSQNTAFMFTPALRGTVWFRGGDSMVPGGTEISLNCYNSINICHSEERLSVLESPSHALSDDIFGDIYHILTFFLLSK